jgi:hypothetical protein
LGPKRTNEDSAWKPVPNRRWLRFKTSRGIHVTKTSPTVDPPLLRGGHQKLTSSGGPEQRSMPAASELMMAIPLVGATRTCRNVRHVALPDDASGSSGSGLTSPVADTRLWHSTGGFSAAYVRTPAPATSSPANSMNSAPASRC